MKKTVCVIMALLSVAMCFTQGSYETKSIQRDNQDTAMIAYPAPKIINFLERKTISDWTKRWDKPDIVCYCYFFIGSNCIGYFVTHGKPASTQSYLIPEDTTEYHSNGGTIVRSAMDLDGTYGTNNPGYRFFLADGSAVECSGAMVSCVYSDVPLSLSRQHITHINK